MARNTSSKADSGSAQSSASIGFDLSAAKNNVVALTGQFFYNPQIAVGLRFLVKSKNADAKRGFRDRLEVENQLALAA
jgi:hypothetical protein